METALKKSLREEAMMSLGEAAKALGVSVQTMSSWNTGKRPINPTAFKKLMALGVPKSILCDPTNKEA